MTPEQVTAGPLPYLRYLPQGQNYPLLLFLHGAGEPGSDLKHVGDHGLNDILERLPEPTLVLAPQCPEDTRWTDKLAALETLIGDTAATFPVDPARIYLTGLSLGGQVTWYLAARAAERFAALVPICGRSNPAEAERLGSLPIWVFHGDSDDTVPLAESTTMVRVLKETGNDAKLTVFPATAHNSWAPAYSTLELYTWLFAQRRSN